MISAMTKAERALARAELLARIALLIAGFVFWIWQKLKPVIASFIADPFMTLVDILVTVLIAAIVLFYAVIPLIRAAGNIAGTH